jgi:hypothetical protein
MMKCSLIVVVSRGTRQGAGRAGVRPRYEQEIFIFSKNLRPPIKWVTGHLPGVKRPGREVNHNLHPLQRLRMSGAIPLLHLCAFVAWTGKTLPFFLYPT